MITIAESWRFGIGFPHGRRRRRPSRPASSARPAVRRIPWPITRSGSACRPPPHDSAVAASDGQNAVAPERFGEREARGPRASTTRCAVPPNKRACTFIAIRAGNEDPLADPPAHFGAGIDDAPDRFVARHQRIAHARKRRHLARARDSFSVPELTCRSMRDIDRGHRFAAEWGQRAAHGAPTAPERFQQLPPVFPYELPSCRRAPRSAGTAYSRHI